MAVLAPEAPKAAAADDGGLTYASFPIDKVLDESDGSVTVIGQATDGTLDSDLQIVDPEWSKAALRAWFDTGANVRVQHNAQRDPAGKGVQINGHTVRARVVEPVAVKLVKAGVLQDFSVGIMNPDIRSNRDPNFQHLPDASKAVNGIITGRADGMTKIGELSLVDRGSNFGTKFAFCKAAAATGAPEWVGELTAPDVLLEQFGPAKAAKSVTVEFPKDVSVTMKPSDLAKLATFGQKLRLQQAAAKAAVPQVLHKTAVPDAEKAKLKDSDRAGMPAGDFAYVDSQGGKHLPVHDDGHIHSALGRFAQQHFESPAAKRKAAKKIVARARAAGMDLSDHGAVVAAAGKVAAPAALKDGDKKGECPTCKGRGFVKKPANMKCEACGGSGRAAGKTLVPDVVKCGTCGGDGTKDGKPCPDCAEKKRKVMCAGCGAHQNVKHDFCAECGRHMGDAIPMMAKNHDFSCLGCGRDLDKGEKFCPGCGRENPGHNAMADLKIPANKSVKERVANKSKPKGKKTGKKTSPFGGNQAAPFGKDKDGDDDAKAGKPKAEKRRKGGKGKGRSPAAGVVSQETMPLPPHREPDGPAVEQFEDDTRLQEGDEAAEMAAAQRHKAVHADPQVAMLHDLTCCAYSPKAVAAALPHASFAAVDTAYWQAKALDAAVSSGMGDAAAAWHAAQEVSHAALTLKTAEPQALQEIRLYRHEAFKDANADLLKTFTDATPGPGSFPSPSQVYPVAFRRPYLHDGHAAESPMAEGARSFPVITEHPEAQDFTRGYLHDGHAEESPSNTEPRSAPIPEGSAGRPARVFYSGMMRHDYEQALSTMHDHLSRIAPGICPMSPEVGHGQKPGRPVPAGVGAPAPHSAKAAKPKPTRAEKAAAAASRKAKAAQKAARSAQRKAKTEKRRILKAARTEPLVPIQPVPVDQPAVLDAEAITKAVQAATAPLQKQVRAQGKDLRKAYKILDAVADRPDTRGAPSRSAGGIMPINKASTVPAGPLTAAESAEQAKAAALRRYQDEWRNSPNPQHREAAYREMTKMLGLAPDDPELATNPLTVYPYRSPMRT